MSLTKLDLDELVIKAQSNDEASFAEICRRFKNLVVKYASYAYLRTIKDDAISEGWLAVVKAVKSYDSSRQTHFAGHVDCCVKYAIWNLFKRNRRTWERELLTQINPEDDGIDVWEAILAGTDVENGVADKVDFENRWALVEKAFLTLSPKQRFAIKRTCLDGRTLRQTGAEMNASCQAVFSLRKRGLERLRGAVGMRNG